MENINHKSQSAVSRKTRLVLELPKSSAFEFWRFCHELIQLHLVDGFEEYMNTQRELERLHDMCVAQLDARASNTDTAANADLIRKLAGEILLHQ